MESNRNKADAEPLNEHNFKRILIKFERKFDENQKLRIKHADCPSKFEASETELFASLDELQGVATHPELYHLLVSKKTLSLLIGLLSHENTDISAKVIALIQEMTDIDDDGDQKHTEQLVEALIREDLITLLVINLNRLDHDNKDELQAINNSLALIDNLIDLRSGEEQIAKNSEKLVKWMLNQLSKCQEFNSMKLSIAELLSVLLMVQKETKIYLNQYKGVDILLQQVAYYRRVAPVTGDEHEYLEQVITCLCTAVLDCEQNRESFFAEEGVDLVELILREKRDAVKKSNIKLSILKLFNHVVTTDENHNVTVTKCCEHFIKVLGLRVLFPIFINPKLVLSEKIKKRDYQKTLDEIEEHTTAIMLAMLKHCQDSELIQRVLVKFSESNFEKFERLLKLHERYFKAVANQDDLQSRDCGSAEDGSEIIKSSAHFTLKTIEYVILLVSYLSNYFEMYDPNSGETFTNHFNKILTRRPELSHQIKMGARAQIEELGGRSREEFNSLQLLTDFWDDFNSSRRTMANLT